GREQASGQGAPDAPPPNLTAEPPPEDDEAPPEGSRHPERQAVAPDSHVIAAARGAIQQTRTGDRPVDDSKALADAAVSLDDPDAEGDELDSAELLKRTLGARIIEEIKNQ